jgi:hypothetical protein
MFKNAGMPNFNPHSFRKCVFAKAIKQNIYSGELLALSKNLGHKSLDTTIQHYGIQDENWQKKQLEKLSKRCVDDPEASQLLDRFAELVAQNPHFAKYVLALLKYKAG